MTTEVKICGLTNLSDAECARDAGADYLGFVLYAGSRRGIEPATLRAIAEKLDGTAKLVGVFVNMAREQIVRIAHDCGLTAVQLHGDEVYTAYRSMGVQTWRAVKFEADGLAPAPAKWPVARYVVDAAVPGTYGGSGQPADWRAAAEFARSHPVMLAGGLTPANVAAAIREVRPLGVDVASGVEKEPGRKDHGRVLAFVKSAKAEQGSD